MTQRTPAPNEEPSAHAYYVLAMLFLVLATSLIDRNILGILLEDIKADLQISDTQLGLLTGPAFAVTNALAGIPLARLADRWSRRGIVAWGLLAWSVMTGLAFALFYTNGRNSDRALRGHSSRRNVILIGVIVRSAM